MNIIEPNAILVDTTHTDPYRLIERVGRLCYKSEDKITEDSAAKFVKQMYEINHHAMLEHYHIMIELNPRAHRDFSIAISDASNKNQLNLFSFLNMTEAEITPVHHLYFLSGSFRAFLDILTYIHDTPVGRVLQHVLNLEYPELFPYVPAADTLGSSYNIVLRNWDNFVESIEYEGVMNEKDRKQILSKHIPWTVVFTCDRGVSHELVRHRLASFGQESTRYCNYGQDRFNHSVTFIRPLFVEVDSHEWMAWTAGCQSCEDSYFTLLDLGASPQEARTVLPNSVKTEIAVTATESEWQHILNLRYHGSTGKPHPQMKEVMSLVYADLCQHTNNRLS